MGAAVQYVSIARGSTDGGVEHGITVAAMRVLVVGAGIVGTIYGWALAQRENEVVHLVRPGRSPALTEGIAIDILDKRRSHPNHPIERYDVRVTESPQGNYDAVIVPTKPYRLLAALREVVPAAGDDAAYFLLTQNWHGTREIDASLPRDRYVYGDAQAGGTWHGETLVAALFRSMVMGAVDGGPTPSLDRLQTLFGDAGIKPSVPENILHTIWVQYAINAGLWPPMIRARGLHELLEDRELSTLSLRCAAECLRVVQARGVNLDAYPEARMYLRTSSRTGQLIAGMAMRALFRFNKAVMRSSEHALGDAREILMAYDDLMASGRELGVPMPVTAQFEGDVHAFAAQRGVSNPPSDAISESIVKT